MSIVISRKEETELGIYSLPKNETDWKKLISNGENSNLEFKSTIRWDMVKNCKNTALENVIIKTVGAFSNSEGGILIIGVDDNGNILQSLGPSKKYHPNEPGAVDYEDAEPAWNYIDKS